MDYRSHCLHHLWVVRDRKNGSRSRRGDVLASSKGSSSSSSSRRRSSSSGCGSSCSMRCFSSYTDRLIRMYSRDNFDRVW